MAAPKAKTIEATFCFVDVAGFTALTEAHGDLAAADIIGRFAELVSSLRTRAPCRCRKRRCVGFVWGAGGCSGVSSRALLRGGKLVLTVASRSHFHHKA